VRKSVKIKVEPNDHSKSLKEVTVFDSPKFAREEVEMISILGQKQVAIQKFVDLKSPNESTKSY